MAGLMGVTAFLSMWINNSAATSIMIPAAIAIIDELQTHRQRAQHTNVTGKDEKGEQSTGTVLRNSSSRKHLHFLIVK
jgi:di/tricarboxylate transporter